MKVVIKNILHTNLKRSWNITPRFFGLELQILLKPCKGTLKDWKKPYKFKKRGFQNTNNSTKINGYGWKINLFVYRMNLQSHF